MGKTRPMNRKGRFSSWSTRFTPWLTLCTACTRTSVLEKLVSALKWTPSTARCCSSTSATSTSQVGAPDSGRVSSTSLIQIRHWETFQMCLGKEDMYSHLWETNVLTSRNSKAFVWIRSIAPIIGLSSEPRLCQRSALQLPGLWMHIVPTNYKRQSRGRFDSQQQDSAFYCSGWCAAFSPHPVSAELPTWKISSSKQSGRN